MSNFEFTKELEVPLNDLSFKVVQPFERTSDGTTFEDGGLVIQRISTGSVHNINLPKGIKVEGENLLVGQLEFKVKPFKCWFDINQQPNEFLISSRGIGLGVADIRIEKPMIHLFDLKETPVCLQLKKGEPHISLEMSGLPVESEETLTTEPEWGIGYDRVHWTAS